ncbi:BPI fold-containing family B member 4-like isoform X2 [Physella acuta]|uniref:BPI fold-containing family B member 4-like isoform X2 n=1 Tax=Physella acuta TaxID=109671 RepID=UPI0027DB96F0|nr:BPI fold-containing family B member 4-like isoform X2 [Physella acuta]
MRLVLIPLLVLVATVRAETDVNDEAVELNRRLLDQLLGGLLGGGSGGGLLGGLLGGEGGLLGGLLGGGNKTSLLGGLLGGDGGLLGGVLGEKGLLGSLLGPNGPVGGILNSLVGPLVDQLLGPKGLLAGLGLNKGLVGNLVKTLSQTLGLDVGEILEIVGKILCLIKKLGLGVVIQLVKILQLDVLLSLNNFLCNANGSRLFDLNVVVNGTAQIGGIDCLLNTVTSVVGLDYLLPSVKSILGTGLNEKCKTPAGNSLIKGVFDLLGNVLNPELVKRVVVLLNAVDLTDLTVSVPKILKALECLLEYFGVGLKLDFLLNLLNVVGLKAVIGAEVQFLQLY